MLDAAKGGAGEPLSRAFGRRPISREDWGPTAEHIVNCLSGKHTMKRSILLALLIATAAAAQNSATIYGTASDAGGAVVPGVVVSITHVETGTSRKTATDAAGGYVFVQLPVGHFTLRAQAQGFKEYVQNDILLQVGENRRVDLALEIGSVNERIEVEAQAA